MSSEPTSSPKLEQGAASDQSIQRIHAQLLREKAEPSEGFAPLPLFLLFLFSALIFFGAIYLERFSGGFDPLVYNEYYKPGMGGEAAPVQVDPIAQGRRLFVANCVQCHQATGLGVPGVYPPLAGSEWVIGSELVVTKILLHGMSGPVTVKGNTYNNVMPAFGPGGFNWKDNQIAWVLTYIRQEWGNAAPPITAETVAAIRAEVGARNKAWTEAELRPLLEQ